MKLNLAPSQKNIKLLFSTLIILSLFNAVYGQDNDEKRLAVKRLLLNPVEINFQDLTLWDFFDKFTATLNINIVIHTSVQQQLRGAIINLKLTNVSYPQAMKVILDRADLDYLEIDERTIRIVKKSAATSASKPLEDFVIKANEIESADQAIATPGSSQFPSTQVVFNSSSLMMSIELLAKSGHIAVEFDKQFAENNRYTKVGYFVVRNTTYPRALQLLLDLYDLKYSQLDRRTIKIGKEIANPSSIPLEEIMTPKEKSN